MQPHDSEVFIIGGGVSASGPQWRQSVRFDFPVALGTAIGAHSDWSGSNTTLSAYTADGSLIEESTGNQGAFMAVIEEDIAAAVARIEAAGDGPVTHRRRLAVSP